MKTIKLIINTAAFILIAATAIGQGKKLATNNPDPLLKAHILGKGKPYADKISLRWNTDSYKLFNNLVRGGVVIDRLIIGKDNKAEAGGWKRISDTIRALTLKQFDVPEFRNDTAKMIVAQGLYGKSEYPKDQSLINQIKLQDMERQNRHLIVSLYTAMSPAAAAAAGLAFDDKMVPDTNKKYVYRIAPAKYLPGLGILDTGYIYVLGHDRVVKENYRGLQARNDDHRIKLLWPKKTSRFTGYFVERSEDKVHFKQLNAHIYLAQADTGTTDNYVYYDSVANYKRYYYRLTGVNAFGEHHTFQEMVTGIGFDRTAPQSPHLTFTRQKDVLTFNWNVPTEKDVKGYYLVQGKGIYKMDTLADKNMLSPAITTYQLTLPPKFKAAYYRLLTADTAGNVSLSNPVYVFNNDTVPPPPPVGLRGNIDLKGKVRLTWASDKNDDVLRGYKIFMSNAPDVTFSAVSGIVADTTYTFTTSLKTTTKSLYVKIVAVNASFSHSKFSQMVKLSRPDTIAPPKPVIINYSNTDKGISLKWAQDHSADFSHYLVYRRVAGDTAWSMLQKTRLLSYMDSTITGGKAYEYSLRTIDSTGLASPYAFPLFIKTTTVIKAENLALTTNYNSDKKQVTVKWAKPLQPVKFYILYKDLGQGLTQYKSIPPTDLAFTEEGTGAVSSRYGLKVIYINNDESDIFVQN